MSSCTEYFIRVHDIPFPICLCGSDIDVLRGTLTGTHKCQDIRYERMGVHTAPLFNFARISDTELADHPIIIGYFAVWVTIFVLHLDTTKKCLVSDIVSTMKTRYSQPMT